MELNTTSQTILDKDANIQELLTTNVGSAISEENHSTILDPTNTSYFQIEDKDNSQPITTNMMISLSDVTDSSEKYIDQSETINIYHYQVTSDQSQAISHPCTSYHQQPDSLINYDDSMSFDVQKASNYSVGHHSNLEEQTQTISSMDFEEVERLGNISEVTKAVGEHQRLSTRTIETIEEGDGSLVFIGPVMPDFKTLDGQETYKQTHDAQDSSVTQKHYTENISIENGFRYNLSVESIPQLVTTASVDFHGLSDNFLRGCKWSPDGSCILTNSNDNCLRVFYPFDKTSLSGDYGSEQMVSKVKMKECGQIYDYAWHPQMNSAEGDSGRIACTCTGIPIHLWDVGMGKITANYRAYDQFDEIAPAYSLAFSLDSRKIYAGYSKAIRIFDAEYPGKTCRTVKTYSTQNKDGQIGIISSFTFSPNGNGLYVAGSYSRHIGMYDSACDKLVCLMQGQHGGVTHLMFSPDATKLYSGGRKDAEILCWDMRYLDKILFSVLRDVRTNQRIYFDLSQCGQYLVSGNNDGTVAFWDTLSPVEEINGDLFLKPCSQFQAHNDCVNGVSFNHQHGMLATASGQRHFQCFDGDSSDSSDEDVRTKKTELWDFSLGLWQIPKFV